MIMIVMIVPIQTKPSGLYRHRRELGFTQSRLQRRKSNIRIAKLVLCYKKDLATLLHLVYFCYLLPVTNYLIIKLSVTDNFSACREYLTEN